MRPASKKQRILEIINHSETELTPKQIADLTAKDGFGEPVKHSTVKSWLRNLRQEAKVFQPYLGSYCNKITYGMLVSPLRVHNVILSLECPWLDFSDDVREWTGDVKVWLQFGVTRRKVTIRICTPDRDDLGERLPAAGMDHGTLLFALNRAYDLYEQRTGRKVERFTSRTWETNRDYHGVRLDGYTCFTRTGFNDFLDRVYQKRDGVRVETKISKDMPVEEMLALAKGGVPSFEISQAVFVLGQKVEKLAESMKMTNQELLRVGRLQTALLQELVKIKEKMEV